MGTALRRVERLLFTVAVLCLAYVTATLLEARYYRGAAHDLAAAVPPSLAGDLNVPRPPAPEDGAVATAEAIEPAPIARHEPRTGEPPVSARGTRASVAGLIGELAIPHLRLSTAIVEGENWQALRRGAGHLRGTALPGQPGNVVLAGHRDTVFRRLGEIRRGDRLRVTTSNGTFAYRVSRTLRVQPRDVWVLDRDAAALTLITCYPFNWVGSAPERWIVQAQPEASPDTP